MTRDDIPRLCAELIRRLADAPATEAIYDVGALAPADLAAVDALARLRLTARRRGCRLHLRSATPELLALLALVGLAETPAGLIETE